MVVGPRFFETLGLRLLQGREFDAAPLPQRQGVVVNEVLAKRLWPDRSPLGRVFRLSDGRESLEVIGVVSNTTVDSIAPGPQAQFYRPFPQEYAARMTILFRVHGDPDPILAAVRQTIREIHADLALLDLRTMETAIADLSGQRRRPAAMLTLVAALGLVLSGVGLYGVTAYGVRRRARELGIRLALGARPADVWWLVVRQGVTIAALGASGGWAAVAILWPLAQYTIFNATPTAATTVLPVCLVLMAATFAAPFMPARWASRRDPALTLRSE
jgi:putative ABC transport system permease protein